MRGASTEVARGRALAVGDAAGLVDPLSGDGMYEAFSSAHVASACVCDVLEGRAADLSAYPARLDAALGRHTSLAWIAKAAIERRPGSPCAWHARARSGGGFCCARPRAATRSGAPLRIRPGAGRSAQPGACSGPKQADLRGRDE